MLFRLLKQRYSGILNIDVPKESNKSLSHSIYLGGDNREKIFFRILIILFVFHIFLWFFFIIFFFKYLIPIEKKLNFIDLILYLKFSDGFLHRITVGVFINKQSCTCYSLLNGNSLNQTVHFTFHIFRMWIKIL